MQYKKSQVHMNPIRKVVCIGYVDMFSNVVFIAEHEYKVTIWYQTTNFCFKKRQNLWSSNSSPQ